ncbi:MAG: LAGLIDADG family homing endonuclease [Candidatus Aenigmatarchaeota archaeon]
MTKNISHIHLFELHPQIQEKIYCFLNEEFRTKFFSDFLKFYSSISQASRRLNISEDKVRGWIKGKNVRKVQHRIIPIQASILFRLSRDMNYELEKVEANIIGLKTKGANSSILRNPKLPIKLDYHLGRLVGCALGDGHLTKHFTIIYSNTSTELIKELKKCVLRLGKIKVRDKVSKKFKYLIIPSIIGTILNGLGVISGNKTKQKEYVRLPKITFKSPLEFKLGVISGLFDDEGSVIKGGKIKFKQALPNLVEELKELIQSIKINTSERLQDGNEYCFYIYRKKDREKVKKLELFKHPEKVKRLNKIIGGDKVN